MNGEPVSSLWRTSGSLLDNAVEAAYNSALEFVTEKANAADVPVCQPCMDALKNLLCSVVFVRGDFLNCWINEVYSWLHETCPEICPFVGECCFWCEQKGASCETKKVSAANCVSALSNPSRSGDLLKRLDECKSFLPSNRLCTSYVDACGCGKADSAAICEAYGWVGTASVPSGINLVTAKCEWCSNKKRSSLWERASAKGPVFIETDIGNLAMPTASAGMGGGFAAIVPASNLNACMDSTDPLCAPPSEQGSQGGSSDGADIVSHAMASALLAVAGVVAAAI